MLLIDVASRLDGGFFGPRLLWTRGEPSGECFLLMLFPVWTEASLDQRRAEWRVLLIDVVSRLDGGFFGPEEDRVESVGTRVVLSR